MIKYRTVYFIDVNVTENYLVGFPIKILLPCKRLEHTQQKGSVNFTKF